MNLLYLEIGIIPIELSKLKLWHFHAKQVSLKHSISNPGSLYSFEAKVLRVLLQLESPKSEHRNSGYVLNNPDYSMIKTEAEIGLNISPL